MPSVSISGANVQQLERDVVHIWHSSLDVSKEEREHFYSLLSEDEKVCAGKFYFEKARDYFIAGRGLLRILLGEYLGLKPAGIQFNYEPQGKPILTGESFQFNISHSEGMGVFAFCLNHRVGVDVEHIRPLVNMDDLAKKFFTANESALISSLVGEEKQNIFYMIWTCKESCLKASGAGMSIPLDQVEVKFEAGEDFRLIVGVDTWRVRMFNPESKYQGAVCVEGGDIEVKLQFQNQ